MNYFYIQQLIIGENYPNKAHLLHFVSPNKYQINLQCM